MSDLVENPEDRFSRHAGHIKGVGLFGDNCSLNLYLEMLLEVL